MTNTPTPSDILDRILELAKDVVNCGQYMANIDIRPFLPGGPIDLLRKEHERYKTALEEISHRADYNGKFCPDPEDCPGCVAQKVLYRKETEERG